MVGGHLWYHAHMGSGQPRRGYLAGAFGDGYGKGRSVRTEVTGVARIL